MFKRSNNRGLVGKSLTKIFVILSLMQINNFEGHITIDRKLSCPIHLGHATLPKALFDDKIVIDCFTNELICEHKLTSLRRYTNLIITWGIP